MALPFVGKDSPLLPNLGVANIPAYLMDILVRSLLVYYMDGLSDVSDAISVIYYVDDGLVRCEGAYSGRDDSPVALRGVEGRGGQADAWLDVGVHDCGRPRCRCKEFGIIVFYILQEQRMPEI